MDINGDPISNWSIFEKKVDIPPSVFYSYFHPKPNKQSLIHDGDRGKKRLLKIGEVELLGDVYAQADHANVGMARSEAVDAIMEMNQNISRRAAALQLKRIVLPVNAESRIVKKKIVKLQAMTSD